MHHHKIIFTGPVGSGKTTAIETLSDVPVVCTDQRATDSAEIGKTNTTVAMDYGKILLKSGETIHLYGTPGQDRFDFMWDILTEGGIGLIILVDNSNPDPIDDLAHFLTAFSDFIGQTTAAIGVTHTDVTVLRNLQRYHRLLERYELRCPLFEVDARDPRDMSRLMEALLLSLDPGIHASASETGEGTASPSEAKPDRH